MATLQQLINNILGGPGVTIDLPEEVKKKLGQDTNPKTPITDLAEVSKGRPFGAPRRTSSDTGSRAIVRMPVSGEVRRATVLDQGPPTSPQGAAYELEPGTPLTLEQMAQRRAQNLKGDTRFKTELDELPRGTPAMSEFRGADMPRPFGRFGQVTDPGQSEFIDFDSPVPISGGRFPGSDENEEIFADNTALSLLSDLDPRKATGQGMAYGANTAKAQNQEGLISQAADTISGLLGNVDFKGLFRVLARPEFVAPMGPGQSPLTNFVNAAAADRTAQAALRAARQEAGLEDFKAKTDRLKALMPDPSKMPKLTGEVSKLYDQMSSSSRISEVGSKIKSMLNDSPFITGGGGTAAQGLRGLASVFGIDLGSFKADQVESKIALLKSEILKSKVFGREANKQELTMILDKMLANPSLLTSPSQLLDTVDDMMRRAEATRYNAASKLKYFGYRTEGFDKPSTSKGYTINYPSPQ